MDKVRNYYLESCDISIEQERKAIKDCNESIKWAKEMLRMCTDSGDRAYYAAYRKKTEANRAKYKKALAKFTKERADYIAKYYAGAAV